MRTTLNWQKRVFERAWHGGRVVSVDGELTDSSAIHHKLQTPHLHQRSSRTTLARTLSNSTDKEDIDVAHIAWKLHLSVVDRQISAEYPVAPAQRRAPEVRTYVREGLSERACVYVGAGKPKPNLAPTAFFLTRVHPTCDAAP